MKNRPLAYLITDLRRLTPSNSDSLVVFLQNALSAGVDMIQIREPDLPAGQLLRLTERVAATADRFGGRVLVNDRADVAALQPGVGVHLTTRSLTASVVRRCFGQDMLVGVSTHSMQEVEAAETAGADFVVFGPVFETASKKKYGPPVGLDALRAVAKARRIPVLALGGIDIHNYRYALDAGASGIAAISLFAGAADLRNLVATIKGSSR